MALLPVHRRNRNDLSRLHSEMDDLFDGVLSIKLPKPEKAKALKVKVKG